MRSASSSAASRSASGTPSTMCSSLIASFQTIQNPPERPGGVVNQRNNAGVVQARRPDHADRAQHLLSAGQKRSHDHSETRKGKESRLGADEDAHALGDPHVVQEADQLFLLFE